MARTAEPDAGGARAASREEIPALLYDASEAVLESLLENPRLDETTSACFWSAKT